MNTVHGIHHVTCIAGDAQENLDFYTRVMGMRLVKRSVNQDVPDTYHLFYADALGTPGTDLTFFPWPGMGKGRLGIGLTVEIYLAIPEGTLQYWKNRLEENKVSVGLQTGRFGEPTLPFQDPHGVQLALVETNGHPQFTPWENSAVPEEVQVRGLHAVRLWERELQPTQEFLSGCLGMNWLGSEDGWQRFIVEGGGSGKFLEIKQLPAKQRGQWGVGSVHHVAWRVKDTSEQLAIRGEIELAGRHPTPQIDRFWFKSVYFKEPGGALFEIATDSPGFGRDEDLAHLGEHLILPPWLEGSRREIEAALPALEMPQYQQR